MPALMLQGTGSDVGKSVLVAGLCRAFANRGLRVCPFKPQNMSTNAAVTADGAEIGRAQALQAIAARIAPTVDMNPVLLKPHAERSAQLIVHGRVRGTLHASEFRGARRPLLDDVMHSYRRLKNAYDLVVVEGAGSPAEINLRDGDIANMGFARAADVPVVLVGDIDRGGVIAAVVGTRAVLDADDAATIRGFIINKFRGDPALFKDGYDAIEERSKWRGFGVVPWLAAAARLPSEDSVPRIAPVCSDRKRLVIACPITPHLANFDDLDPLRLESDVDLRLVPPGRPLPDEADVVILAGSKATIADLHAIRREGWDIDILSHHRRGRHVLGLCGGYQMLGQSVADPHGLEGRPSQMPGLGLLDIATRMEPTKTLRPVRGTVLGAPFEGYEMHLGVTEGQDTERGPVRFSDGRSDGAASADGRVMGTYVHGLFGAATARAGWLAQFGVRGRGPDHSASVDAALDDIARELAVHLDLDGLLKLAYESC